MPRGLTTKMCIAAIQFCADHPGSTVHIIVHNAPMEGHVKTMLCRLCEGMGIPFWHGCQFCLSANQKAEDSSITVRRIGTFREEQFHGIKIDAAKTKFTFDHYVGMRHTKGEMTAADIMEMITVRSGGKDALLRY